MEESVHRLEIFIANVKTIEAHNWRYHLGQTSYYMGLNYFADMTFTEFKKYNRLGEFSTIPKGQLAMNFGVCSEYAPVWPRRSPLPATVDWTQKGAVTPIKNQQQCGSCWTFSATGSIEGQNFLKSGKLISLSEQQIVDCCQLSDCSGCEGGLMDSAFRFVNSTNGLESEADYPYTATDDMCAYNPGLAKVRVTGCDDIQEASESDLQDATANVGPISVAIDASHGSFQMYSGGVYYEPECDPQSLDHGVLVVGYGSLEGQDYWKVKNSWGVMWGMNGFILMSRDQNNNCGIASSASFPHTATA
ncbi:cathepsin L1 [Aplysia californica]|uniref:Cathepsin L1 n=1 Tax=Aplysia californica TaxID=6500 RepID=A0ABM1A117_APLCA|nr:cathepsin L1 [Aplysia californica]